MTRRLLCAVGVVLMLSVSAQSPADQLAQVRQVAAQRLAMLGACQSRYQAPVEAGDYVSRADVLTLARAAYEQANPGKTLSASWAAVDAPPAPVKGQ